MADFSSLRQQCEAEFDKSAGIAADPVVAYMKPASLEKAIDHLRQQMLEASKRMDFIEAAQYRDEMLKLQQRLDQQQNKQSAAE